MDARPVAATSNKLLRLLAPADREQLQPLLEYVELPVGAVLFESEQPIPYVHFLHSGIASVVAVIPGEASVEVGMTGCEGMAGWPVLFGGSQSPHQGFMQAPGCGHRMRADVMRTLLDENPSLRALMMRYAQWVLIQIGQSAACNARHSIEERLARWLLMAHDRVKADEIPLTHEFLAEMLGVRRAGVTVATHVLEGARIIQARRGRITIIHRAKLEEVSCACYRVVEDERLRLLG
jgi:CRP-like cAMP-binding protein